jgi:hypothetical protein
MMSAEKRKKTNQRFLPAGDIGETNTCLGIFPVSSGTPIPIKVATYTSREHKSLEELVTT